MDEDLEDMKEQKAYYRKLDMVANAQQGIRKLCPSGSITKEVVDEEDSYDYLPGKRYFICKDHENDGLHFRQPWVIGMQEEVERLKELNYEHEKKFRERFYEQENILIEQQGLKDQVRKLHKRLTELERAMSRLAS